MTKIIFFKENIGNHKEVKNQVIIKGRERVKIKSDKSAH